MRKETVKSVGKRAAKRLLDAVLYAIALGVMLGLACCGDNTPADPCYVAPDWNVGYQDCGRTSTGERCVAGCGVLPQDGSPGHLLPVGCTVEIGTSAIESAICVATCGDCH